MLHDLTARHALEKGKKRQHLKHALMALAIGQRIHMRNAVAKRLKDQSEGLELERLQNAARIAHGHGGYIRKAG